MVCERTKPTNLGQRRGLEVLETAGPADLQTRNERTISYVQVPDSDQMHEQLIGEI